jgi:predicted cupin superfamily sugar epimerase
LVSCAVAPGFMFRDFELFTREELLGQYPQHAEIIGRLTKE